MLSQWLPLLAVLRTTALEQNLCSQCCVAEDENHWGSVPGLNQWFNLIEGQNKWICTLFPSGASSFYICFASLLFFFSHCKGFIYLKGRVKEEGRIFHPLIHSPEGYSCQEKIVLGFILFISLSSARIMCQALRW